MGAKMVDNMFRGKYSGIKAHDSDIDVVLDRAR